MTIFQVIKMNVKTRTETIVGEYLNREKATEVYYSLNLQENNKDIIYIIFEV